MASNEVEIEVEALYAKRKKIHAREVRGFFATLRKMAVIVLLGIYYIAPWPQWGTRQAILFDLPARQFHILGLTLWPQDFVFLAWLLIMAALLLFFATAVAGRVWCGYVCPQTVWTEIFVWMEQITEGNFNQRIKLDKAPLSAEKILRKGAKQILWVSFATWTGFTFVGYFTPIRELGSSLLSFNLGGWEAFWVCFYSLATYGNAGALREQVCIYMCPYARFQSAMFDRDTLIVSYDPARGEPRGGRSRSITPASQALGDCIDCQMCVQACPTGIDIRKGLQYECISCAACVDVCDDVMDKVGYPRGLIRYTTQNALEGQTRHVLRPRVILYGGVLLLLFASFVITLGTRATVRLDVIRDRNTLYRELPDGHIENVYQLKILNKQNEPRSVRISIDGLPGARVETSPADIELGPGALLDVVARISVERSAAPQGRADLSIRVESTSDGTVQAKRDARFIGPRP